MALDNVLKIYDEQGNPVDYDILASDVKFQDGKDLPTKLTELEGEIDEGGYAPPAGGIPATDLAPAVQTSLGKADSAYQKPASGIPATDLADGVIPDVSGLATKTELQQGLAAKVDKVTGYGLSKNDYTDSDKAKVASAIQGVIVGSTEVTPDSNNKVTIPAGVDGITPHIGANDNWWVGPETDSNNDTGIKAQGPAGTSYTSADLEIGNALNGEGDVLGMDGAMRIKSNVDSLYASILRLYNKLANMAFWDSQDQEDAEPTALDWSVPKVTVTITNSIGSGAVIKRGGTAVSGSLQVDQGDSLTLTIEAATGMELSNVAATVDGVTTPLTESSGIFTLVVDHVNTAITIVVSGNSEQGWSTVPHDDLSENGVVVMYGMQQGRSMMAETASSGRGHMTSGLTGDESGDPQVVAAPAGMPTATKVFTTARPDGVNKETNPGDTQAYYLSTGGKRYLNIKYEYTGSAFSQMDVAVGCFTNSVIGNVFSASGNTAGFVGRYPYGAPNEGTGWKIDLNTFATQKGFSAGAITYVKLLFRFGSGSTYIDTRNAINNLTVKYKFTDD